ncbi:MAG: pyridoxal-phosphate dependent enzyme [Candidatus Lambdaproteobacteria bacterium]|nr:pyridoxal-phosphate dependent enzyme [Candidatus Lambdaproteobacteria bacterium]
MAPDRHRGAFVEFAQIEAAAARLQGVAHRTPVLTSRTLDALAGCAVFLKCENLQRTGAFKIRGAYNALASLSDAQQRAGVITYSSGNHGQAVALAGKLLAIRALIVMPTTAPKVKVAAVKGYGGEVVTYDPARQEREEVAAQLQAERGLALVPPFNHPAVMAGQGTAALELVQDVPELDAVLAPCGGGGLLSGTAVATRHLRPGARVIGVEPEGAAKANLSVQAGRIVRVEHPQTKADGLMPKALGDLTFAVIREQVERMVTVNEEEIRSTLEFLWSRCKLVVEPSGAVGLAAVFHRKVAGLAGGRVGVILSGGNADIGAVADWFRAERA